MVDEDAAVTAPGVVEPLLVPRIEVTVLVEGGEGAGRRITLDGDLLRIGSHPSNDIVLEDRLVSRFHCRLQRGKRAWAVMDTGSLNGTGVNGIRVRDADLTLPECRIEVGESVVVVREVGETSLPAPRSAVRFGALCGATPVMRKMFDLIERVAPTDTTVLIEGESGTGKELITGEIVRRSKRADKPFVVVDCGSLAPGIVESELFGHARGAFTGADRLRIGAFEAAAGGTVFLDEVGELPAAMQPKLLRVLENREVRRMGENTPRRVDVRVVAATNRQIEREVNQGRFREDLFFRLSGVVVRVPPLFERKPDIPLLVESFLASIDAIDKRGAFTAEVLEDMMRHDWPGNVGELKQFVERFALFDIAELGARGDDLSPGSRRSPPIAAPPASEAPPREGLPHADKPYHVARNELIESFERSYLAALLRAADGNVSRAARKGQINRMHLHRLLQRHGLRKSGSLMD